MSNVEPAWRTASHSIANGQCVSVGSWRKARRSAANGACVSVGSGDAVIGVRDTKLGESSPVLVFPVSAWQRFASSLKSA